MEDKLRNNLPTIPTTIEEEIKTNIFKCDDPSIKQLLNLKTASDDKVFSKLRDLKDSF